MASINRFGALAGLIKKVKRTGWLRYLKPQHTQSVGDHTAKIAMLSLYLRGQEGLDFNRCLQMSLVHDIAEGIVGDFTPYCSITPEEKHHKEHVAFLEIFQQTGEENLKYFEALWLQYEEGATAEAKMVKDLDKLEMMQQALVYEKQHGVDLSQFYTAAKKMRTELGQKWASELLESRKANLKTQS